MSAREAAAAAAPGWRFQGGQPPLRYCCAYVCGKQERHRMGGSCRGNVTPEETGFLWRRRKQSVGWHKRFEISLEQSVWFPMNERLAWTITHHPLSSCPAHTFLRPCLLAPSAVPHRLPALPPVRSKTLSPPLLQACGAQQKRGSLRHSQDDVGLHSPVVGADAHGRDRLTRGIRPALRIRNRLQPGRRWSKVSDKGSHWLCWRRHEPYADANDT